MTAASAPLPKACDVVVVGAGIVGTAVAASLAAAGLEVCVLERSGPAAGASSAGEGNLLVSDKLPGPELALAMRSLELWRQLAEDAGRSIEWVEKGGLVVAWDGPGLAALRSLADAHRAQGVSVEMLSGGELPGVEPALSRELAGGAFYPEDRQVQPMLVVAWQARKLVEHGGTIVRGAEVTGARHGAGGAIAELSTSLGAISVGSWVVNAAGAWAGRLAALAGGCVPVQPRKGHVLVTEPLTEFVRHKVYEAGYLGSIHEEAIGRACAAVVESTPAGTMLIGSSREFVGFAGQVDAGAVEEVARQAVALVPGLAGARLMRAYAGLRPATPDCLPVIGADLAVPNLLHATGHEGAGILLSQVTAELVECLVLGREPPLDLAPFSPGRFTGPDALAADAPAQPFSVRPRLPGAKGGPVATPAAPATAGRAQLEGKGADRARQAAFPGGPGVPGTGLVHFSYDGRPLVAPYGTTLAGALLFNGESSWRATRGQGRRRGLFCGIGNCFDCLVDLDGHKAVRACLEVLQEGCEVRSSRSVGAPDEEARAHAGASVEADLAVLGAGPAGMAAAIAAASRGARVVLVDSGPRLGGQFFRQPLTEGTGAPGPDGAQPARPPAGHHLPARWHPLVANPSVELLLGSEVWSASNDADGYLLRLVPQHQGGAGTVRSRALVLATGASELTLPFPGWELPGVLTAGAAQALLKSQGLLAGGRVVVAGTGPFLLPVAAALADAGARVTAVEAAPARSGPRAVPALLAHPAKLVEAAGYAAALARHGVRFLTGRAVVRAEGALKVERAVLAHLGPGWRPVSGTEEVLEADSLCVSYGFVPRLELARQLGAREVPDERKPVARAAWGRGMETSVPGLFVAGELAGVAGAEVAELEGELAGHTAASYLGLPDRRPDQDGRTLARRLQAARAFGRRLEALYPLYQGWLGWLDDATVFCRCEEVTWGAVREAIGAGAATAREVRNVTRCGMGYCQGRTCGPALQLAVSALAGRPMEESGDLHKRPVAVPVALADLACRALSPLP
ncbi:MAG: FAD-dependent oxidoreductase [Actinomycetota bacterium]|nr:FAD-dependent oxidoreductase [Actinomycetota bacterium]